MPIRFNLLLSSVGLDLSDVRLLRHKERSAPGRSPYDLWRDNPPLFEAYQARQGVTQRSNFGDAHFWASFVVTPTDETLFAGIHHITGRELLTVDAPMIQRDEINPAGSCDTYAATRTELLADLIGRLVVDWGTGTRAWIQRADKQDKVVLEIRRVFEEPDFPGFQRFVEPLSRISSLPKGWVQALRASRGVYLLTCPRTREQYVGSATGEGGFWQRWLDYFDTGHGGNVELKSREPSDYQVAVLEVAGSAASAENVLHMEALWKAKLQSREMGLNRN